jgi:hypothetical protein
VWGLGSGPKPPNPNPQSPIPKKGHLLFKYIMLINIILIIKFY